MKTNNEICLFCIQQRCWLSFVSHTDLWNVIWTEREMWSWYTKIFFLIRNFCAAALIITTNYKELGTLHSDISGFDDEWRFMLNIKMSFESLIPLMRFKLNHSLTCRTLVRKLMIRQKKYVQPRQNHFTARIFQLRDIFESYFCSFLVKLRACFSFQC